MRNKSTQDACHPIASSPRKRKGSVLVATHRTKSRVESTATTTTAQEDGAVAGPSAATQLGSGAAATSSRGTAIVSTFFSPVFSLFCKGHATEGSQHEHDPAHPAPAHPDDPPADPPAHPDVASSSVSTSTTSLEGADAEETAGAHPAPPDPHANLENIDLLAAHDELDSDASEPDVAECIGDIEALLFIKNLPALTECVESHRRLLLPLQTRRSAKKTLVLDLDETLVHSSLEVVANPDFVFPVTFSNQQLTVRVRRRPHLHTFIERVAELYEVVVFTASQKVYAEKVLNVLDPDRKFIRHRVYRDSCLFVDGNYMKDLSVLGRDLKHTLIVDNSPQAFGFQLDNGIPIESWYDDDRDQELLRLLPFLERLADVDDVRPHIQTRYKMRQLVSRVDESMVPLV